MFSPDEVKKIIALADEGKSQEEIAVAMGMGRTTLVMRFAKSGYEFDTVVRVKAIKPVEVAHV